MKVGDKVLTVGTLSGASGVIHEDTPGTIIEQHTGDLYHVKLDDGNVIAVDRMEIGLRACELPNGSEAYTRNPIQLDVGIFLPGQRVQVVHRSGKDPELLVVRFIGNGSPIRGRKHEIWSHQLERKD